MKCSCYLGHTKVYFTAHQIKTTTATNATVRVALAVQCLAQHATSCSTAQHPCVLQHNATIGITHIPRVVLAALGGQHCGNFGVIWLETAIKVSLIIVTYLRSG